MTEVPISQVNFDADIDLKALHGIKRAKSLEIIENATTGAKKAVLAIDANNKVTISDGTSNPVPFIDATTGVVVGGSGGGGGGGFTLPSTSTNGHVLTSSVTNGVVSAIWAASSGGGGGGGGNTVTNMNQIPFNSTSTLQNLVYSPSSTDKRVRGIRKGANITITTVDSTNTPTTSESSATDIRITASMDVSNMRWNGAESYTCGVVSETINGVTTNNVAAYGVRGAGGITVSMETNPSDSAKKNIVITGSGGGGGGGSGVVLGTYSIVPSNGVGIGLSLDSNQKVGFKSQSITAYKEGIGFQSVSTASGLEAKSCLEGVTADACNVGVRIKSNVLAPIVLEQKSGTIGLSSNGLPNGTLIHALVSGYTTPRLYFKDSSGQLFQISMVPA